MVNREDLHAALTRLFGHQTFRPGQEEIIRTVLSGRPTLAVMPTGAGKSLCFQLPALLLRGLTLVISPLVALMKDQVDALLARNHPAGCIHSGQSEAERAATERALSEGTLRLVYVAPERLRSPRFQAALKDVPVDLLAVDEAHCISEMGHSFRPDYEKLGEFVEQHRPKRLLALTATATPDVRADIVRSLRLRDPAVRVAGFDRPNIHLEIHRLKNDAEKRDTLANALAQHRPAIVYTATRRQTETLARLVNQSGSSAVPYHAGMSAEERERIQDAFIDGRADVVVATNAFGLGIDKPDVRLVAHMELPRSLESYYQEIGRAGRDGLPAVGLLLFATKDQWLQKRLLALANPSPAAVQDVLATLARGGVPITADALARSHSQLQALEVHAALRFLEGLDVVERQYQPGPLRFRLSSKVDPSGDGPAAVLARRLGGHAGELEISDAMAALGMETEDDLRKLLEQPATKKLVRLLRSPPRTVHALKRTASLSDDDFRRLRVRSFRDKGRLQQMSMLAHRNSCRRHALLRALGEEKPPRSCTACDVCAGPVVRTVRSRSASQPSSRRGAGHPRQGLSSNV